MSLMLGIDIAKDSYHAALWVDEKRYQRTFRNAPEAFPTLLKWVGKHTPERVPAGMEATGRYGEALADYLHAQGHVVYVLNPSRISRYAQAKLRRNKTDPLDAALIADYCLTQQPEPWTPPAPEVRELQALARHWEALQELRTQQNNRLQAAPPSATVRQSLTELLAHLDEQLASLEKQLQQHIAQHPELKQQRELLVSIIGIGPLTAAKLLGENIQQFSAARALVAYAGLNPQQRRSGSSVHPPTHLSKVGNAYLRHALYWPAIVAMRHNPIIRAFCQRLLERGKAKMAVIGAAMRKLLALALGVLKSGQPFDPQYLNRANEGAA